MMFKGDEAKGELNGFLDAGSHIQGELHFEDTFRIDGKVTGKIQSAGDLVVGERGVRSTSADSLSPALSRDRPRRRAVSS